LPSPAKAIDAAICSVEDGDTEDPERSSAIDVDEEKLRENASELLSVFWR
jgi:hypothetical protein